MLFVENWTDEGQICETKTMQTAVERRQPNATRMPIDIPIELSQGKRRDSFCADSVNVGLGGLSIRAPFLPDIGSNLHVHFSLPNGDLVDADCEVVWAHDRGPHLGEFGLRFTKVYGEGEKAILEQVTSWRSSLEHETAGSEVGSLTQIHLDTVPTPIDGRILHQTGDVLVVEQELPFLKLGQKVKDAHGTPAHLSSVQVISKNDIPHLLMTLEFGEGQRANGVHEILTDTSTGTAFQLDTLHGDTITVDTDEDGELEFVDEWNDVDESDVNEVGIGNEPLFAEQVHVAALLEEVHPVEVYEPDSLEGEVSSHLETSAEMKTSLLADFTKVKSIVARFVTVIANGTLLAWKKARRLGHFLTAIAKKLGGYTGEVRKAQRTRKQSKRTQVRGGKERTKSAPKIRGRWLLLIVAVLSGLFIIGLRSNRSNQSTPAPDVTDVPTPEVVEVPSAVNALDFNQGAQIPGANSATAEQQEEPAENSVIPSPVRGLEFGEASPTEGRTFTLRMSKPVREIEGIVENQGFSVTIPGALSLDPAGPIATAMPNVRRAAIFNNGDYSILTLRFLGNVPKYRVVGEGASLRVTIAEE